MEYYIYKRKKVNEAEFNTLLQKEIEVLTDQIPSERDYIIESTHANLKIGRLKLNDKIFEIL